MSETSTLTTASPLQGETPARRQFRLPEDDEEYLDELGLRWETLVEGIAQWVVIHNHPLPPGYTAAHACFAIQVTAGYPAAALDMGYFYPPLALISGRGIPNTQFNPTLDGRVWQGWSRHRTGANAWQLGIDSLKTHHALMKAWVEKEVQR